MHTATRNVCVIHIYIHTYIHTLHTCIYAWYFRFCESYSKVPFIYKVHIYIHTVHYTHILVLVCTHTYRGLFSNLPEQPEHWPPVFPPELRGLSGDKTKWTKLDAFSQSRSTYVCMYVCMYVYMYRSIFSLSMYYIHT